MKVALEAGEVLDIALLEGERVIGTLSLQLKGLTGGTSRVGRPAKSDKSAAAGAGEGAGRRRKRKPMSPEARARMAEAQRRRWEKTKGPGTEGSAE